MTITENNRTVLAITGSDRSKFLQDLITNDISELQGDLVYAALLSPKGKYLFDFFLFAAEETIYLDVQSGRAAALVGRLTMYKLRADVEIKPTNLVVSRGLSDVPEGAKNDPRDNSLGWRYYGDDAVKAPPVDWTALRISACIPTTGTELVPEDTYILEAGFERLKGVDFSKGCYVGQEVTARMKHKTELRKGFVTVSVTGPAEPGTPIERDGRAVGTLFSRARDTAIAYLRFDRAGDGMTAGDATVGWQKP